MNKKILIIDDDEMNLKMAEFILKQKFYNVQKAASGMEGLLYLRDNRVDLVLLDLEMPVMSGMKTLEIIRDNAEMADTPVIFLTASSDLNNVVEASKLGIVDYVTKPFLPQVLLQRVEKVFL